jgi:hypothetical protein
METEEPKKKLDEASKKALLSQILAELKDQVLFPQRVKEMKEYLAQVEIRVSL